jgi:hypothetical protein
VVLLLGIPLLVLQCPADHWFLQRAWLAATERVVKHVCPDHTRLGCNVSLCG